MSNSIYRAGSSLTGSKIRAENPQLLSSLTPSPPYRLTRLPPQTGDRLFS
ncbi:hypothetical protein COLO4_08609 [Corchorus olitorius]|uniref:Uncharacterized protein n=1 Tax=Corchorus olitorius TaxID=93759 RepID=A0A1R3KF63_9ROSI|nr:hypothetical protein COLO4_08609 [Corchorus olitorius]